MSSERELKESHETLSRDSFTFLPAYEEPQSDVERKIASFWADHMKMDRVGRNDDYFELSGDSFCAVAIAASVEAAFDAAFTSSLFTHLNTVAKQAEFIATRTKADAKPTSLEGVQINGRKRALFHVHGGMGTTFVTREFLEFLGPDQPVYFFRLPGIDGREKPLSTLEAIAARYVEQMRQVQPDGPYNISANCSCSAIGLEMALQLQQSGQKVRRLLLIDPPRAPRRTGGNVDPATLQDDREINPDADWNKRVADFAVAQKSAAEYKRRLRKRDAKITDGQSFAEVSDTSIEESLEKLIGALVAYHPKGKFEGRIHMVFSDERSAFARSWQRTCSECMILRIPGSHNDLFKKNLKPMVHAMRAALKSKLSPEQIAAKVKDVDILRKQGKTITEACVAAGLSEMEYNRYQRGQGGGNLKLVQKLRQLEMENEELKRKVAKLSREMRSLMN